MSDLVISLPPSSIPLQSFPNIPAAYIVTYREFPQYCKIGHSIGVDSRLRSISGLVPFQLYITHLIPCYSVLVAYLVEQSLHDTFNDKHVKGEWYALSNSDHDNILLIQPLQTFEKGVINTTHGALIDALGTPAKPYRLTMRRLFRQTQWNHLVALIRRDQEPHGTYGEWISHKETTSFTMGKFQSYELAWLAARRLAEQTSDVDELADFRITNFGRQCFAEGESEADHA